MTPVKRRLGLIGAMLAFAEAVRVHNGAYQRHTKRLAGWGADAQRRGAHAGRHPGAFGGGLRRYAFPAGYTGPMTPARKRRIALREAARAAGMAVNPEARP